MVGGAVKRKKEHKWGMSADGGIAWRYTDKARWGLRRGSDQIKSELCTG